MPRIVGGSAGGRRLAAPPGRRTRPTAERVREGLFSSVGSMLGALEGCRVADLYAGSGAVGLEALSRGAEAVLLVEADARAAAVLRSNAAALGLPGVQVLNTKVEVTVAGPPAGPAYDLVFLDPPYDLADRTLDQVLRGLVEHGWLTADAVVAVERASRGGPLSWPPGYTPDRSRRYGEATVWYARAG